MENREIFNFPQGLPGFEKYNKFELVRDEDSALAQLISEENKDLGFIVIPPGLFINDYYFELNEEEKRILKVMPNTETDLEVWCILTHNSDIEKITVNLRAPVILNLKTYIGLQLVLTEEKYLIRHPLPLPSRNEEGAVK